MNSEEDSLEPFEDFDSPEDFDSLESWRDEQYVDGEMLRRSMMTEEELVREYIRDNLSRFDGAITTFDDFDGSPGTAVVIGSSGSPAHLPETYIITDGEHYGLMGGDGFPEFRIASDRIQLLDWDFAILHNDGKVGFYIRTSYSLVEPEYDEVVAEPGRPVRVRLGDEWGCIVEDYDEETEEETYTFCPDGLAVPPDGAVLTRRDYTRWR